MRGLFDEEVKVILKSFRLGEDDTKTEETIVSFDWLLSEMKNEKSTRVKKLDIPTFYRGKIYIFNYKPITPKDMLSYWDEKPIFLFFDFVESGEGILLMGLNLNWYPIPARKFFLNAIRKFYNPQYLSANKKSFNATKQLPVNLDIKLFSKLFAKIGFLFGVRTYKLSNIKGPIYSICFEDWNKIANISKNAMYPQLKGKKSLPNIYKEFKDHIVKKQ